MPVFNLGFEVIKTLFSCVSIHDMTFHAPLPLTHELISRESCHVQMWFKVWLLNSHYVKHIVMLSFILMKNIKDNCDRLWQNPAYGIFCEIWVSYIFNNLYPRANLLPSLRPIARFTLELERFVYDHVATVENEKLRPKGVAMYAYCVSVYYAWAGNQLNSTWAEPFEMSAKVEL